MSPDDLVAFLRTTELLAGTPDDSLAGIARQMRPLELAPGAVLFEEGSMGDAAYLILEGDVALVADGVELLHRGPGDFVGEFALIDDQPRSASVVSRSPLRALAWDRASFARALAADPSVARGILRTLTSKLRTDVERGVGLLMERDRWRHDLTRSREIQVGMLPAARVLAPGLELAGHCAPAGAVGGDFYDVVPFADGRTAALMVDVTGHGFHCGLFVAMAKSCLHAQARFNPSPARMMAAMRATLALSLDTRMLMTCAYLLFDPHTGHVSYANAGHPHPLLWTATSGEVTALEVLDPILGAQDVGEVEYRFRQVPWCPGDVMVLYSDGVTEARSPEGEEFGRARLEHAIARAAGADAVTVLDALLDEVQAHARGTKPRDDLTLVVARAGQGAVA